MDGVTPGMVVGASTEAIAGEGLIATAGGIDTHIHFISPQQIETAIGSGITTMIGGGSSREVLSKDQLLEALSFFLVRVPKREAEEDKPERPAFTLFPPLPPKPPGEALADISAHFATKGDIGKKYLADHSAGSGKTLSICWLADRLHSLYKPGTNEKLVDITFILTDRNALDTISGRTSRTSPT